MAGMYYEDFTVGDVIRHEVTRTVTETDNLLITALTMNVQPLHLDAEFAKKSMFGKQIVNSIFTLGPGHRYPRPGHDTGDHAGQPRLPGHRISQAGLLR